jgi:glycosyltransferase involved in cell wall biosynthesis
LDTATLAEHLLTLLNDVTLQEKMGEAGEKRVMTHFNVKIQSRKLENLYDSLT